MTSTKRRIAALLIAALVAAGVFVAASAFAANEAYASYPKELIWAPSY